MSTPTVSEELKELPPVLRRAFGPLKKRALGFAVGTTLATLLFAVSGFHLVFQPGIPESMTHRPFGEDAIGHLRLLSQFLPGYDPANWAGAFVGIGWVFGYGFFLGVAMAALRNTVVRASLFTVRARGNLAANKGFLDQI